MATIRYYFMAKFYDVSMRKVEERCLGEWRSELLGEEVVTQFVVKYFWRNTR